MRTTVILPDELYAQVKRRAQEQNRTVTSFMEAALRRELSHQAEQIESEYELRPYRGTGGAMPGVDLNNNAALLDLMDEGLPLEKLR